MQFIEKKTRRHVAEINVVPYIDVMLVLLVIFMATAPIIMQGVQVNLPKMQAKTIVSDNDSHLPIVVSIDANDNLYLNIADNPVKPIDEKKLQIEVAAAIMRDTKRLVTVKADNKVSYNTVLKAMVLLQTSGVDSISLETGGATDAK